jgi:hypothetical protein
LANEFGRLFGIEPVLTGEEEKTAFLSNSQLACRIFGRPEMPVNQVIKWIAGWLNDGHVLLGKPTHFEVRDGKY